MKNPDSIEGCLTGSIAILATLLLTAFIIVGCSAPRAVTQLVEHIQKDTFYLSNVQYDSIYIYQDKYTDRSRDTLYIKDKSIEYRYKLLRDTVRVVHRDSIPYEIRVDIIKEVPRKRNWFDILCYISFGFILYEIIIVIISVTRKS